MSNQILLNSKKSKWKLVDLGTPGEIMDLQSTSGYWMAVTLDGYVFRSTDDYTTWSHFQVTPDRLFTLNRPFSASFPGRWVTSGTFGEEVVSDDNGATWYAMTRPDALDVYDSTVSNSNAYSVGQSGFISQTPTGINSSPSVGVPSITYDYRAVDVGPSDLMVAMGVGSLGYWKYFSGSALVGAAVKPVSTLTTGLAYGSGLWVASQDDGNVLTSTDPTSIPFVLRSTPATSVAPLTSIIYNSTKAEFVTVGYGGCVMSSPDGINWTDSTDSSLNIYMLNSVFFDTNVSRYYAGGILNSGNACVLTWS